MSWAGGFELVDDPFADAPAGMPPPVIRHDTHDDCSAVVVTVRVSAPVACFQKMAPVTTVVLDACPSFFQPVEAVQVGLPSTENATRRSSPATIPAGRVTLWVVESDVPELPVVRAATVGNAIAAPAQIRVSLRG